MILEVERLGPYRLQEVLGKGGMGVVYLAEDERNGELVAIKTVRTVHATESLSIRREIRALSHLRHPGVVAVRESGQWAGIPWYAMDLHRSETLREWQVRTWAPYRAMRPAPPSATTMDFSNIEAAGEAPPQVVAAPAVPIAAGQLPAVLTIVRRLLLPLSFLHARGLVHRDLKPANVFLAPGLRPIIADFGLARQGALGAARERMLDDWHAEGTPAYMSPEAIRGELVDARADLYAIGCILYELCAGERPFVAEDDRGVLHRHLTAVAPPLASRVTDVPPALEDIVQALLQKAPNGRPGAARDVMAALDALGAQPEPDEVLRAVASPVYRPRLAGRDGALASIVRALDLARAGQGRILLVGGPSGIGKTHLVNEAARRVRGSLVVSGRCDPVAPFQRQAAGLPLHPLRPLLERIADRCAADPEESARLLGTHGPLLGAYAPRIGDLPSVRIQPPPPQLAGAAERDRLFVALSETLDVLAEQEAVVLLIDDLQWADELTLDFLAWLQGPWLAKRRLAVVATWRTEESNPRLDRLLAREWVTRLNLGTLDAVATGALIRDMLSVTRVPDTLIRALLENSHGSPFAIAEVLRLGVLEGAIRRLGPNEVEVRDSLAELLVPIGDLVARRLTRLEARDHAVMDAACVIGRSFELAVVHTVVGGSEAELIDAINELIVQQILIPAEGSTFTFAHDKLVEFAYSALPEASRRDLNGRVAAAIERNVVDTDQLRESHATIAHHWLAAGDTTAARTHLEAAAKVAFEVAAYDAAGTHLRTLLELGAPNARARAVWEQRLGECSWNLGDLDGAERWTRASYESLGRPLPTTMPGWLFRLTGALIEQSLHLLGFTPFSREDEEGREDLRRLGVAANVLCWRFIFKDDLIGVTTMAVLATNWVERGKPRIPLATAHGWIAYNAGVSRLPALAARYFARGREDARSEHDQPGWTFVLLMEAMYHGSFGRWGDLRRISEEALAGLATQGDPQNVENHLTNLATGEHLTGNFERSTEIFEQIEESARRRGNAQHIAWGLYGACWGLIGRGDLERALPRIEEAWTLLEKNADAPSEILTASMLALVQLRRGEIDAAKKAKEDARIRVLKMRGAVYPVVPGIVALADVLIELVDLARREGGDLERAISEARTHLRILWVISLLFPFCAPILTRCRGALLAARGDASGQAVLREAIEACTAAELPFEAAQAWWLLGRYYPEARAETWRHAEAAFTRLGAQWHLATLHTTR